MVKKKNKTMFPLILFFLIIFLLLLLAYYYKDRIEKIIKIDKEEKIMEKNITLKDCIKQKNITLYGTKGSKITEEQINEIEDIINLINFIDCEKEKERCKSIHITPAWNINENYYFNVFSKRALILAVNCEDYINF
ncbi:MAG: hypothetical protein QW103_01630 [Candidatus Pacearchaeota archaeon]